MSDVPVRLLSTAQDRIWFSRVLKPEGPRFDVRECIEGHGNLGLSVVEAALRCMVSEPEALHLQLKDTDETAGSVSAIDSCVIPMSYAVPASLR